MGGVPMDLTDALPRNELVLAQLTADKLGKVMHGLVSVGTASLELESPADFLTGREKTPLGFLEVLRCIGVKPGHADKIELLRERVGELSESTNRVHGALMELADWRNMPSQEVDAAVDRLGESYARFCKRLDMFCSLLGMESNTSDRARQDIDLLEAFFQTVFAHPSNSLP
jgi:hypothetical protein